MCNIPTVETVYKTIDGLLFSEYYIAEEHAESLTDDTIEYVEVLKISSKYFELKELDVKWYT